MELEKIHKLERAVLFLMIIALPINCLPKRFSIFMFGQNLTDYSFLMGLALLIYFERELYFFLTRKTVFSKKTALSCIFFRISIDNLGPYMCYTNSLIHRSILKKQSL